MADRANRGDWAGEIPYDRARVDYSGVRPHPADEAIERLAWIMDNSIPLPGGFRIGLDPILGLIPGAGDVVSGLVSAAVIIYAHRAGVPRITVLRMLANVGIDSAVGTIPLVGDLFDFAFRANTKNLALYRQSRAGIRRTGEDYLFLVGILLVLAGIIIVPILLIYALWTTATH